MWFCAKCGELLPVKALIAKKCGLLCKARSICRWRIARRAKRA